MSDSIVRSTVLSQIILWQRFCGASVASEKSSRESWPCR